MDIHVAGGIGFSPGITWLRIEGIAILERISAMTLFSISGLIVAALLVVYLFIALLKPELFS